MDAVTDLAVRTFFSTHPDIFGERASFLHFKSDSNFSGVYGFKSDWLFGHVAYENEDGDTCLSPPLALKLGLTDCSQIAVVLHTEFSNEIFFYTRVLPFFSASRDLSHLFPRSFASQLSASPSSFNGAIVFENLQAAGFRSSEKRSFLDYDHLVLMMRRLGEFHAYSYEARRTNPHLFLALARAFVEPLFFRDDLWCTIIPVLGLRGIEPLREILPYSSKVPELEKSMEMANTLAEKMVSGNRSSAVAVLCHGDYLQGNVLFKYEQGKPADLKIIDLATCKLASPVVDLAQVLYINADQRMRDEHWHDLIDVYYSALTETFPDNEVPSRECIEAEFKSTALFAYFLASFFLSHLIAEDNTLPTYEDLLPAKYRNVPFTLIPPEERIRMQVDGNYGGEKCTEALANILKDMINRGFV